MPWNETPLSSTSWECRRRIDLLSLPSVQGDFLALANCQDPRVLVFGDWIRFDGIVAFAFR